MRNQLLVILVSTLLLQVVHALVDKNVQSLSQLRGKVTDKGSGEPILFGNVALYYGDELQTGVETDNEGNYSFSNIDTGVFDLEVSYVGYVSVRIKGVIVKKKKANICNVEIVKAKYEGFGCSRYYTPIFSLDFFTKGKVITAKDIRHSPVK